MSAPRVQARGLRIMHILRSPVGGLFRHVIDLARGQSESGHDVGIIADASTGGARADAILAETAPLLRLGTHRVSMHRAPHPSDIGAQRAINRITKGAQADIIHGHGSKGGLYARLPGIVPSRTGPVRAYTPHGGSLHYTPGMRGHFAFTAAERLMERGTDLFLFESRFAADRYREMIKATKKLVRVVYNGLHESEFESVAPVADASDLLFIGELRVLKGIDTLIDATRLIASRTDSQPTLTLVGAGPDENELRDLVSRHGMGDRVRFAGAMPAREAFALGRLMVVPSRKESLPYVVLEALAAGMPLVSTNVGGIPEIFGPDAGRLVPADAPEALAEAILGAQHEILSGETVVSRRLRSRIHETFTVQAMVSSVMDAYRAALDQKRLTSLSAGIESGSKPAQSSFTEPGS